MNVHSPADEPSIGVMGCLPELPLRFPLEMPENAGNMIHAMAPFEMFGNKAIFYKDDRFNPGDLGDFSEYVNNNCTHLIVTLANFLKLDDESGLKYERFHNFLKKIKVPIVIFGLGAQSKKQDLDGGLPKEAIDLMKFIGDSSPAVGVRGAYTAAVFEHFAGVKNTYVTGCPSFFSKPESFRVLREKIEAPVNPGVISYNGTTYHDAGEKKLLIKAIKEEHFLVEPVNKFTSKFALDVEQGVHEPELPWFLKGPIKNNMLTRFQVEKYFSRKFKLFRHPEPWYEFNRQEVAFTHGTRFHVNMASLLSGVPALWITHDSRTQELTDFLRVPRVSKEEALELTTQELIGKVTYDDMFDSLPQLFQNFNNYLEVHQLPAIAQPDLEAR